MKHLTSKEFLPKPVPLSGLFFFLLVKGGQFLLFNVMKHLTSKGVLPKPVPLSGLFFFLLVKGGQFLLFTHSLMASALIM